MRTRRTATSRPPIQIVVTPGSGNGRALEKAIRLRDELRHTGRQVRLEVFSDLDCLGEWAARGQAPFSLLVCVGGDGTLDTTALAAARRSVPFLAMPSGFGNLFGRALRQPQRVAEAIDLLEHGTVVQVDVGMRNGKPFLCHESFGLLCDIQEAAETGPPGSRAGWRRGIGYYQTAIRHLRDLPVVPLRVSIDGRTVARDAAIVTVANVETYGPWLNLTPAASPTDGLLDVFVMRTASKGELLRRLLTRQLHLPAAGAGSFIRRGRRIAVLGPGLARNEIHVMPRQLPVVVSGDTAAALARVASHARRHAA